MAELINSHKLVVLAALDKDDEGNLIPAFEARQIHHEGKAVREAKAIASQHAGVITWSRDADPAVGEYGPSEVLFKHGDVPEMEWTPRQTGRAKSQPYMRYFLTSHIKFWARNRLNSVCYNRSTEFY